MKFTAILAKTTTDMMKKPTKKQEMTKTTEILKKFYIKSIRIIDKAIKKTKLK